MLWRAAIANGETIYASTRRSENDPKQLLSSGWLPWQPWPLVALADSSPRTQLPGSARPDNGAGSARGDHGPGRARNGDAKPAAATAQCPPAFPRPRRPLPPQVQKPARLSDQGR